jgi:hypothetical protein
MWPCWIFRNHSTSKLHRFNFHHLLPQQSRFPCYLTGTVANNEPQVYFYFIYIYFTNDHLQSCLATTTDATRHSAQPSQTTTTAPGIFSFHIYIYSTNDFARRLVYGHQSTQLEPSQTTTTGARDANASRAPGMFYNSDHDDRDHDDDDDDYKDGQER